MLSVSCKRPLSIFPVLFSMSLVWAAEHPGLYFSHGDLPSLRSQAQGAKALQFSRLQRWGETHLEERPPQQIGTQEKHHESCFSAITNYGLLFQITGEEKYLSAGLRWVEALLSTSTDGQGEFHVGTFSASLAHGYDLFYNHLSPEFKSRLKERLIQVLEETRWGASNAWWAGIYTHHDFWIPVAFMGVAALCLKGEYENADSIADFAADELSKAMELLGEQGYWPEGVADWVYGMAPSMMFFDALRRSGGPDFYEHPWMRNTAGARLSHWLPDAQFMYIGDSFPSGRYGVLGSVSAHLLMRLAARYRDGNTQWLALREAEIDATAPAINSLENPYSYGTAVAVTDRERHGLAWQFLWYDPSVSPTGPEELATDTFYRNWDTVIFRAGWEDDDPVLAFSGGHLLGRAGTEAWRSGYDKLPGGLAHTHQNAGAVYLWSDGRFPIMPPGFGGRDGRFHSTVMVNGHGQLFDPNFTGQVTAFESSEDWAMARMDLSKAYPKEVSLAGFTRTVVFLKPRTILVLDRLHGGGDNYLRRYEWLLHTDPETARWTFRDDSLAAVSIAAGAQVPLLIGRIFPSYRYYFERQSLDRPDGKPLNRAMSVTIIGRMPSHIEIASILHTPGRAEDTGWLKRAQCVRSGDATTLTVPDGPYFVIPTGPKGNPTRSVVFAQEETVAIPEEVPEEGLLLVVGLPAGRRYEVQASGGGSSGRQMQLLGSQEGEYVTSEAGNLVIRLQR